MHWKWRKATNEYAKGRSGFVGFFLGGSGSISQVLHPRSRLLAALPIPHISCLRVSGCAVYSKCGLRGLPLDRLRVGGTHRPIALFMQYAVGQQRGRAHAPRGSYVFSSTHPCLDSLRTERYYGSSLAVVAGTRRASVNSPIMAKESAPQPMVERSAGRFLHSCHVRQYLQTSARKAQRRMRNLR